MSLSSHGRMPDRCDRFGKQVFKRHLVKLKNPIDFYATKTSAVFNMNPGSAE